MSSIPENIKELLKKHNLLTTDAAWELPQRKGTWILKHKTLEALAAKMDIKFNCLMCSSEKDNYIIQVTGFLGDKEETSFGEANSNNCKNQYPVAMAEKRGKDRVILKLLGLHGDVYSEEEADDFKPDNQVGNGFANAVTRNEYAELINLIMDNWTPEMCDTDSLKKYCKRVGDTLPELKTQLAARFKLLQEVENEQA